VTAATATALGGAAVPAQRVFSDGPGFKSDGKIAVPSPDLLPGGITAHGDKPLPLRRSVAASLANATRLAPPQKAASIFWDAIQSSKNYAMANGYSVLGSQPFDPANPNARIADNPLLATLVEAARYCSENGVTAWELFSRDGSRQSLGERYGVISIVNRFAAQLDVAEGRRPSLAFQRKAFEQWEFSDRDSYIYAQALAVPEYGELNPSLVSRKIVGHIASFPEKAVLAVVAITDGLVAKWKLETPHGRDASTQLERSLDDPIDILQQA
jgi:hypothetical protein